MAVNSSITKTRVQWNHYIYALAIAAICTVIALLVFPHVSPANLSMIYLAGIVFTALYSGIGPSVFTTLLSVAAFDFLFTEPYRTFAISDVQNILTLFVMLLVAITVSSLAVRSQQQTEAAKERERHTTSLYDMNRKLADAKSLQALLDTAAQHIYSEFGSQVAIFIPNVDGSLKMVAAQPTDTGNQEMEFDLASRVFKYGQTTNSRSEAIMDPTHLYVPLRASKEIVGVLGLYSPSKSQFSQLERRQLVESSADQIGLAIERMQLTIQAQQAQMEVETERLRSDLLSSVSHDLRTPLAAITGATSTLLERGLSLDSQTHHELSQVAYEEAQRLNRLVGNLLDMTRLESGGLKVEKEWQTLEEVVGVALRQIGKQYRDHPITAHLPPDLPFIPMDSVLIEQVLLNLLENAMKYTPPGTSIEISATYSDESVTVQVADRGPGIPLGDEQKIFDKFYRASPNVAGGVGLGLTISKGIIEAHGGKIWAKNRPDGGAVFSFTLPLEGKQPELNEDL